ncbi:MAG: ribonuclease P protein component [candidate division FCPU426 bacterium]
MPIRYNLPKKARITDTNEFNKIITKGKRINCDFYRIHYEKSDNVKSKIGIIVSRKIKNKALKNKYKRRIKEYFRKVRVSFKVQICIVIIIYNEFNNKKSEEMLKNMTEMFKKEKII